MRDDDNRSREETNEQDDEVSEISNWLRKALARADVTQVNEPGGARPAINVVKTVLVHLEHHRQNDKAEDVETYEYVQGNSVEDLAHGIGERAAQDARAIGGGSYFVRVEGVSSRWAISFDGPQMHQNQNQNHNTSMVQRGANGFMSNGGGGGGGGYGGSGGGYGNGGYGSSFRQSGGNGGYNQEPMNPAMAMLNAMVQDKTVQLAHNERILDLAINGQADNNRMMRAVISEQHETIRSFEKEKMKGLSTMEELYSRKHERDLEFNTRQKNEERKDRAIGLIEPLAMSVAARFFGAKGIPGEMAPIVTMLTSAFDEMNPERLQKLVTSGILTEKEVTAMLEMFKVLSQIEEEKLKKQSIASGTNGTNGTTNSINNNAAATNGAAR